MDHQAQKGYFIDPPADAAHLKWVKMMKDKPVVPGQVVRYEFLPPRGYWGGLLKKGQVIRVIDLEGNQCFDTIMYDANNLYNRCNTCYTTIKEGKWDNWQPGDAIWSRLMNKLAIISEDTSEGHHAFVGAFCSEGFDRVADGMPNMHSCHDNFVSAMRMAGFPEFSAKDMDWGSCISVFMNLFYKPDGSMEMKPVTNKPGDYIDFMAERDIVVTLSNCPYETANCNNWLSTAMYVVVFEPNEEYVSKTDNLKKAKETEYSEFLGYTDEEYNTFLIKD